MIDYAERVEQVLGILNSSFGMPDREAAELLLAAQVPNEMIVPPWIILETECYSFDMSGSWFNLGQDKALSLPQFRVKRPRTVNEELAALLAERLEKPMLFIEPNFERPVFVSSKSVLMPYLLQGCLRVRSRYPRTRLVDEVTLGGLRAAVAEVNDDRWRGDPVRPAPYPPWLLYNAELLQRLSEPLRDWNTLIANLCAVAQRRAFLFNRDVDSTDWAVVGRVMQDSVPLLTKRVLLQFESHGHWHSLKGTYGDLVIQREIKRLVRVGVVWTHQGKWRLVDPDKLGKDVCRLVQGQIEV